MRTLANTAFIQEMQDKADEWKTKDRTTSVSTWQVCAGANLWVTVTAAEAAEYVSLGGRVRLA